MTTVALPALSATDPVTALLADVVGEPAAASIVGAYGPQLRAIVKRSAVELASLPHVGRAKARKVVALASMASHLIREPRNLNPRIREPEDVVRRLAPILRDMDHEEFWLVTLDSQSRVLGQKMITKGILDSSLVHPREVFRAAIQDAAAGIIVAHNHPSGDPTPSAEDRTVTRQLVAAGQVLDIPLHDHVIIAGDRFTSFAAQGLL